MESSQRLYNHYRTSGGLLAVASFIAVIVELLREDGWDNWRRIIVTSVVAISICGLVANFFSKLTRVRIDNDQIDFFKLGVVVPWLQIKNIERKWYGLYKVTIEEGTFYFPPATTGFPFERIDGDFDELIDFKKRHYQLGR